MLIKREWVTPIVMGAFTLSGLTGVALDMAQIFEVEPEALVGRLQAAGFQVTSSEQSVADVAGAGFEAKYAPWARSRVAARRIFLHRVPAGIGWMRGHMTPQ